MSECLCKYTQFNSILSASYSTTVYAISCEQNSLTIVCTNFICTCNPTARRLFSAAPSTTLRFVYKMVLPMYSDTVVAQALPLAYEKSVTVTSRTVTILPTTELAWNMSALFWIPSAVPAAAGTDAALPVGIIVAVVVVIIVCMCIAAVVYTYWQTATPKPTKVNTKVDRRVIYVRLMPSDGQNCENYQVLT